MHTDFERAAQIANPQVFPDVVFKGCNFYFGQALNRKLHNDDITGIYRLFKKTYKSHNYHAIVIGEWIGCLKALSNASKLCDTTCI